MGPEHLLDCHKNMFEAGKKGAETSRFSILSKVAALFGHWLANDATPVCAASRLMIYLHKFRFRCSKHLMVAFAASHDQPIETCFGAGAPGCLN